MADLILLTIDSLRADYFDKYHFPELFDSHLSDFVSFETVVSNGIATPFSFPAIHTGYPVTGAGKLPSDQLTIAEEYDGYCWAISNNPHLRAERGYDRGFDCFTDYTQASPGDRSDPIEKLKAVAKRSDTIREIYNQVKKLVAGDDEIYVPNRRAEHVLTDLQEALDRQSGFFWAHFMEPHMPYYPQYVLDRGLEVSYSNSEMKAMNDRYRDGDPTTDDLEFLLEVLEEIIGYLDRQLATFFDYLKTENRWKDSMIVLMSDHGEAFGEHGFYNHPWDSDPIDELIQTPLVVKFPNNRNAGNTYTHLVQNGDLFATLVEEFNWSVTWPSGTAPFLDERPRSPISKSNYAIRVTTTEGYAIQRRDEPLDEYGNVDESALERLKSESFPKIETHSGELPGVDEEEQQEMIERLEFLGYK